MKHALFANQNTGAKLHDADTITALEQHFDQASNRRQRRSRLGAIGRSALFPR
jgi:hypothetical protein